MGRLVPPPVGLEDRISPGYLALQLDLHERAPLYGTSSTKFLDFVEPLIAEHKVKSVLDYGCGKGGLKKVLGDIIIEYDPAIPGKDADPEVCDMLVCTDVLEHIEPGKLASVLEHTRQKCRKIAFFSIATRLANKSLADGRNAHLIVESMQWWQEQLAVYFDIKHSQADDDKKECIFIGRPYLLIGQIDGVGVMSNDDRFEHIKENMKLTDKRLMVRKGIFWFGPMPNEHQRIEEIGPMFGFPAGPRRDADGVLKFRWVVPKPHNRVAIVMCYGPSLEDTWQQALMEQEAIEKADIVSVSGAHDYLIERGIIPRYHVECDPREHKGDMVTKPHRKCEYLMATCCHPKVVKKLAGPNLTLWHLNNGKGTERVLEELDPNGFLVPGGGSVGLRSIVLLYVMGYRRFIIHGMDCSYRNERSHAGHHTGKKIAPVEVISEGKKFMTAPVLITYMRYFEEYLRRHIGDASKDPSKIEIILRGDGLLQHWLISGGAALPGPMPTKEAA